MSLVKGFGAPNWINFSGAQPDREPEPTSDGGGDGDVFEGTGSLEARYGAVTGHMDGQSHPAINKATPLYGLLFGKPFRDRKGKRKPRQFGQSVSRQAIEEAIDPKYKTTEGEMRTRFGGEVKPKESDQTVDMRTRLLFHSPLNDRRPPAQAKLASGQKLSKRDKRRLRRHKSTSIKRIDRQIAEVEAFAKKHPNVRTAKDAAEARRLMNAHPDGMVMMTSVEGGTGILNSQADADALRKKGVTHLTLVHLADDENGAAATVPGGGLAAKIFNPRGVKREAHGEDPGLSKHGEKSMEWLANGGVVMDLSHMSHGTLDDALDWCEKNNVSPVISHGFFERADGHDHDHAHEPKRKGFFKNLKEKVGLGPRDHSDHHGDRAVTEEQLVRLYKQGGQFGMVLSGKAIDPEDGTMNAFVKEYQRVTDVLHKPENIQEIFGLDKPTPYSELTTQQRTRLSLAGAAGDFNAMAPAEPTDQGPNALPVEKYGLSDPGVVPSVLEMVVRDTGGDPNVLEPLLLGAERSLQISEKASAQGSVFRLNEMLKGKLTSGTNHLDFLSDGVGTPEDVAALNWLSGQVAKTGDTNAMSEFKKLEDLVNGTLYREGMADKISYRD